MKNQELKQIESISETEFTYCNVCTLYTEIVKYREDIDLALCAKCVNNPKAIRGYLLESML